MDFISIGDLAEGTGIEPKHVVVEVERLIDGGYIPGALQKLMTGGDPRPWFLTESRLTERGARAVAIWPRAENFIVALQERAEHESDPVRKHALLGLLEAARDVGVSVLSEVITAGARHAIGMP